MYSFCGGIEGHVRAAEEYWRIRYADNCLRHDNQDGCKSGDLGIVRKPIRVYF